jgi:hypothetical protein
MSDYDCITQHSPGSEPGPSEPGSGSSEQLAVFTNGEYGPFRIYPGILSPRAPVAAAHAD